MRYPEQLRLRLVVAIFFRGPFNDSSLLVVGDGQNRDILVDAVKVDVHTRLLTRQAAAASYSYESSYRQ